MVIRNIAEKMKKVRNTKRKREEIRIEYEKFRREKQTLIQERLH